ncbi:MAG: hypothetical protein AAF989_07850 [Planctomycetota bacterium]
MLVLFVSLANCETATAQEFSYPIAIAAVEGDGWEETTLYVVDLEMPGVWQVETSEKRVFAQGSKTFKTPLNRPRCIAIHPAGGILVGDTSTREIYHVKTLGDPPKPLTNGKVGIPMSLAVSPDGDTLYVADAERGALVRLPLEGGEPEWFARVNARSIAFDESGNLIALTPNDEAILRIDPSKPVVDGPARVAENPAIDTVLGERTFQYPVSIAISRERYLICDSYAGHVWGIDVSPRSSGDDAVEDAAAVKPLIWHDSKDLERPVGIAAAKTAIWVVDAASKQVLALDPNSGELLGTRK